MATTEQLMAQYGVAWFGFDEASGDVYDKLGLNNYVGTVTGTTRVQGWNGEGNALNFNGTSDYVQFNTSPLLIGEKTIRLKLKLNSYPSIGGVIIGNSEGISTTKGISILVNSQGFINVFGFNTILNLNIFSKTALSLNKWYDIMFTQSGRKKNDIAKLYINEVEETREGLIEDEGAYYATTRLGRYSGNSTQYLNGQIDDLQIYNKALSPSDFTQKRIVVKTTDNKNLSVLNGRIKEIPNATETALLEQGRIIREIDDAVGTQPVDLVFNSTQYEITNNTNSALGNSKVFSLPINKEFKTITIEDNY